EAKEGIAKTKISGKAALVVLAGRDREVYWTKPADFELKAGQPLPSLFEHPVRGRGDAFRAVAAQVGLPQGHAILADGTFRTIEHGLDDKALRTLVMRDPALKPAAPPAGKPDDPETIWTTLARID